VYSSNITLFYRNSPYRVQTDLTIETRAILTIETGVQIYFDAGVGIKIKGAIWAV
uniref:Accessory Sec system protein Asp3 n=1 Tax=Elaeophora elaphi TaxID=1147741 RepID=A0A0R3RRQ6_9BILA